MMGFNAILTKQMKVFKTNPAVLIQFAIFPLLALLMRVLVPVDAMTEGFEEVAGMSVELANTLRGMMVNAMPNLVTMQATMFAGMALIPVMAGFIAEDIEKKSLRFLTMAGVKPTAYLLGIGLVVLFFGLLSSVAFSLIAGFGGMDFIIFTGAMVSSVAGSLVLGATIGILMKNQQMATALAMPAALVFGFGPMIAQFSDGLARVMHPIYTQQLNVVADRLNGLPVGTEVWQSFAIMWANVLVLAVLFALAYRKKGIKE